jgi:hypothetical protein
MFRLRHALASTSILAVTVAVVINVCVTPIAGAADPTSLEADTFTLSPALGGSVVRDSTASGGTALSLTSQTTAYRTVTLPASTQIVVRAKSKNYNGFPP